MYDTEKQYRGFLDTEELLTPGKFSFSQFKLSSGAASLPPDFVVPDNIRLGQRMEYYLQALLEQSPRYEIITKNLQIIADKITLGELDFIIKDLKNEQLIHLEQVYKFYLFDPSILGNWASKWIGNNRRDSLDKKIYKLKNKQLPLLFKPETKAYLETLGVVKKVIEQQVSFKGQLFLPCFTEVQKFPEYLNPKAVVGKWYRADQLQMLNTEKRSFFIPPKNDWVSKPDPESFEFIYFSDFNKKISVSLNGKRSLLFWTKDPDGNLERNFAVWW